MGEDENNKSIPVIDCPICLEKDVPMSFGGTYTNGKNHPSVTIWFCSSCGKVPNIAHELKVKRYISIKELKDTGW